MKNGYALAFGWPSFNWHSLPSLRHSSPVCRTAAIKRASVTERIGITDVTIDYSRPGVKGREGKIWGQLIPVGIPNRGLATTNPFPGGPVQTRTQRSSSAPMSWSRDNRFRQVSTGFLSPMTRPSQPLSSRAPTPPGVPSFTSEGRCATGKSKTHAHRQ